MDRLSRPRDEDIEATMRDFGVTRAEAEFIVAVDRGEIPGDRIDLTEPMTPRMRARRQAAATAEREQL